MLAQTATFKDDLPIFLLESLLSIFFGGVAKARPARHPEIPFPPQKRRSLPGAGDMSVEQAIFVVCFPGPKIQVNHVFLWAEEVHGFWKGL